MTDTANILDMNEDELLAQFKARDTLIESLRQQLAECQAREKVLRDALEEIAKPDRRGSYSWFREYAEKAITRASHPTPQH